MIYHLLSIKVSVWPTASKKEWSYVLAVTTTSISSFIQTQAQPNKLWRVAHKWVMNESAGSSTAHRMSKWAIYQLNMASAHSLNIMAEKMSRL